MTPTKELYIVIRSLFTFPQYYKFIQKGQIWHPIKILNKWSLIVIFVLFLKVLSREANNDNQYLLFRGRNNTYLDNTEFYYWN